MNTTTNIFDTTAKHKSHLYISSFFHRVFRSYELKLEKPDKEIFRYLLKETKSEPEESVFIDDQVKNVLTAKRVGFKGITYMNIDQLKIELKNYGVKIGSKKFQG